MHSDAQTVDAYLAALPEDRRAVIAAVLAEVRKNLPPGYEEAISAGMISWQVPLSVYPKTYNGHPLMYAALASQKNHMALYLMTAYGLAAQRKVLEEGFRAAGKKVDMGKACLRFKKLDDLALPVIGSIIAATPMASYVAWEQNMRVEYAAAKAAKKA